jgi:hypothetical protein
MILNPIYGQISYNCCHSNAFRLKLGYNPKTNIVDMKRATVKEIAKYIIRPAMVLPGTSVKFGCAQQLIMIARLCNMLTRVEERRERRIVGKRMILVLTQALIEKIELIVFHPEICLFKWLLVSEISNNATNFRITGVWAHLHSIHQQN